MGGKKKVSRDIVRSRILRDRRGRRAGFPRAQRRHRAAIRARAERSGRCYFYRWIKLSSAGGSFSSREGETG